jgi:hypothetical protein
MAILPIEISRGEVKSDIKASKTFFCIFYITANSTDLLVIGKHLIYFKFLFIPYQTRLFMVIIYFIIWFDCESSKIQKDTYSAHDGINLGHRETEYNNQLAIISK